MEIIQAIVLGLVQGLTEFLPISSSAHLGLVSKLMDWQEESLTFDILLHLASLVALIIYFRKDITGLIKGLGGKDQNLQGDSIKFFKNIIIALIPLIPFYLLFNDLIESSQVFSDLNLLLLIIFGALLIFAERIGQGNKKEMQDITLKSSMIIGISQCLSLFSGVSRSGITITAGLLRGLKEKEAKRFAFLLAIPTILGAFIFELRSILMNEVAFEPSLALFAGLTASFLSALSALHILFKLGDRIKLSHYGIYRIILGIILLIIL